MSWENIGLPDASMLKITMKNLPYRILKMKGK